ncbi:rab GTPase-binding effector protein 1 isoform X9 [Narcine bancroftii]|uniref:rab GTPase-binding effector protein 1 isoform X9 n=1 Tax=Narcine bancroftii TaxID=1343680 RepID=UPI00383220C1
MAEPTTEISPPQEQDLALLQQRLKELEQAKADFLHRKEQLEFEFNQKRAKFKELYLAKEEELKRQNVALQSAEGDITRLQVQLMEANADMENIKAVAAVSETTKQEAIDDVKKQWQEEVASMQEIMKETLREYEIQFHHRLEQERTQWGQYKEAMERELVDLRRRVSEGQGENNLENDMKKAQEDAEKLRSVVMPMEKEIGALKEKLSTAEENIKELEASKQVKELNHYLETEKSCRTDLEMYVAVLNTQKTVLQEDAEKLRKELHEVCHLLEQERQQHNQLKHTWQRANDQFLESQRLLMRDMQRMENILTSEQLRQVEELKHKEQTEDEQKNISKVKERKQPEIEEEIGLTNTQSHVESPVKSPHALPDEELYGNSIHGSAHSLDSDLSTSLAGPAVKQDSELFREGLRRVQSTDSLGTSGSLQSKSLGYGHKAKSAGNLDESDFGPLVGADSVSENFDTVSVGSFQMSGSFILTKDQEKAIKALTPEQEETASLLSSLTQVVDSAPSGYRMVSEKEWNLLQQEVQNAGNKLGRRCDMCSNYEKQLQGIQVQEGETRDQLNLPILEDGDIHELEEPFTDSEIKMAMLEMPNGKSPGDDGFSVEFYKIFYDDLSTVFGDVLHQVREHYELPDSCSSALITLIPKKDRDPLKVSSYRSISLLNVDYKIIAKILANRLAKFLPKLIHIDQTGFIKDMLQITFCA